MEKHLEEIFEVLSHRIRRKIIRLIGENRGITYSEILGRLNIDTGTLNYHLSKMKNFIVKNDGRYFLNPNGLTAYRILKYVEDIEGKPVMVEKNREFSKTISDFINSFLYIYMSPIRAFSEVRVKPKTYTFISILFSSIFLLLSIYLYNFFTAFLTYLIPLVGTIFLVKIVYKTSSQIPIFLINYGLALSPAIIFLLVKLILLININNCIIANSIEEIIINYFLTNIFRPLLTVIFLGYLLIGIRESYKLSNSQSFVIIILILFLSKIIFTALNINEIIYLGI